MKVWIVVMLGALAVACSDSSGKENNGTVDAGADQSVADSANAEDIGGEPDQGGSPDMPSTPDLASDAAPDAGPDAAPDTGPDAADMNVPDVPPQMCSHPPTDPTCPMGEFGAGTFLDYVEVDESRQCCRDFNGDGVVDNKIAQYATILRGTGTMINDNIDAAVKAGQLAYLLEYSYWENDTFDGDLVVRTFLGGDTDIDFTDNLAGNGSFWLLPESFESNGAPKWVFESASVSNGHLTATGGRIQLFFPNLLDEVQMVVNDVTIEADVVMPTDLQTGGRVSLQNGELSGALDRNLFYDSMNEAAAACTCLGKPVFAFNAAEDKYDCDIDAADETGCAFDPSPGCRFLSNVQQCAFLSLVSTDVDVDQDGDGNNDAFSVGALFTGVGANIMGRQP